MAEEKTTFEKILDEAGNIEKSADIANTANDIYISGKVVNIMKVNNIVGDSFLSSSQIFQIGLDLMPEPKAFQALDKSLGGFKAAVAVGDIINKELKETASALDYTTAGLDAASGAISFFKIAPGIGNIASGILDAASGFIKCGQAKAEGADGTEIAGYALDGAAGILTAAAGICTLIPGFQVAVPFILLAAGICELASLICANWDAIAGFFQDVGSWIADKFNQGVEIAKALIRQGIETAKALLNAGKVLVVKALKGAIHTAVAAWNKALNTAAEILVGIKNFMENVKALVIAGWNKALDKVSEIVSEVKRLVNDAIKWLASLFKRSIDIARDALKWWNKIFKDIKKAVKKAMKEARKNGNKGPITFVNGEIRTFARGGFPLPGQPFWAREAGPELVGVVGGHTAVVNNGQIVEAVSHGVYSAFLSAFRSDSAKPAVARVFLDGKEIAWAPEEK